MKSSAKRKFRRFENFYKKGQLQPYFIKRLKSNYEDGFNSEFGIVESWFDYCKDKYGDVVQPQLGNK